MLNPLTLPSSLDNDLLFFRRAAYQVERETDGISTICQYSLTLVLRYSDTVCRTTLLSDVPKARIRSCPLLLTGHEGST